MVAYSILIYERNYLTSVKVDSLSYTLKLDESLDSGVLTIPRSTRKAKFARFSRVEISINDTETITKTTWLIYRTKVEIDSRGSTKTYNHTIGLIEPTKWLEKFIVGSLTFTQPLTGIQKTLYDYVERIRQLTPFVPRNRINSTRIFTIDADFKSIIETVPAPQMYLDKKNLREALIEIFKVVNAIPRLYYDKGWVLTGDFINQRKLEITIGDGDIDYIQEAAGEDFAQSAEIFHENTIVDNIISEGIITDFISFRNNDIILGESDLRLVLSEPISELINFEIVVEKSVGVIEKVSLNDYIFEKKVYDTLDFDNSNTNLQATSVYWTYKSNEIVGFSEKFGTVFENIAIERILNKLGARSSWEDYSFDSSTVLNLIFRVEYKPYIETMRSIQYREDIEPYVLRPELLDLYSGLIINQGERINELYDLTDNVYGQIQRLGVDTVSTSKKHYLYSGIYNMGDYTEDNYYVTKVEVIPYTTYFIARYEFSKNWNRLAQFIQIDREFRPYEVSLSKSAFTLKRDVLFLAGVVEISKDSNLFHNLGGSYTNLISSFMNTFKNSTYENNISFIKMKSNATNNVIGKHCISAAEKNGLKWKIDFQDTKLAGKNVTNDTSLTGIITGRKIQQAVYYTRINGELNFVDISLHNGLYTINYTDIIGFQFAKKIAYDFPLVDETISNTYVTYRESILDLKTYNVNKDGAEVLGIEVSLPVLPKYDDFNLFVVGEHLLKENTLIKKREISKVLYFYGLTNPVRKNDTNKIDVDLATRLEAINSYVITNYIQIPNDSVALYNYFAIADYYGNLYLGVNQLDNSGTKTIVEKVYFNFLENRTYPEYQAIDLAEVNVAFNLELSLAATYSIPLKIKQAAMELEFSLTADYSILEIFMMSASMNMSFDLAATYRIGVYQWFETTVSVFNAGSVKHYNYRDIQPTPLPDVEDYQDVLKVTIYDLQSSNVLDYNDAGTQIDINDSSVFGVANGEAAEDVLEDNDPSAFTSLSTGVMTDTVIKITDGNLDVTYWKPDYTYYYYIVDLD